MNPLSFHSHFRFFGPNRPTKKQVEEVFLETLLSCGDYLDLKSKIPLLEKKLREVLSPKEVESFFKIVPLRDHILIISSRPEDPTGKQLFSILRRPEFLKLEVGELT